MVDRGLWKPAKRRVGDRMDAGVTVTDLRDHSDKCDHGEKWSHAVPKGEGRALGDGFGYDDCPGGRAVTIDDEADTEDVYQKETWLPDVSGEGRYIWMIRSDVSIEKFPPFIVGPSGKRW